MRSIKLLIVLVLYMVVTGGFANEIDLPAETASYRPSESIGYQLVLKNCMLCHSADYAITQPPNVSRDYWVEVIYKMKKVFGAPIAEDEIPFMVDYLVKQYGSEKSSPMKDKESR